MKTLVMLMTTFTALTLSAQKEMYRKLYFEAKDANSTAEFYNSMLSADESAALARAYKGAASAMYAGFVSGIPEKLSAFNKGRSLLDSAVKSDWYNAEIRFLRYSIQSEAPFFLGYSGNRKEDIDIIGKAAIEGSLDFNAGFWQKSIRFILDRDHVSQPLREHLKAKLNG